MSEYALPLSATWLFALATVCVALDDWAGAAIGFIGGGFRSRSCSCRGLPDDERNRNHHLPLVRLRAPRRGVQGGRMEATDMVAIRISAEVGR